MLLLAPMILLLLQANQKLMAQPHPPRPVRINATSQVLAFGAFYQGPAGGTITVTTQGIRSQTGSIVLLNLGFPFSAALFEVHANPGTIISILNGPDAVLAGSLGGSMTVHIGASDPASPFVANKNYNIAINLYLGGRLNVGPPASNPPGSYSGTFNITLVQE